MVNVKIEKPMKECIFEAFEKSAIISSDGLEPDEYIFVCNGKAYYEDGGCFGTFWATRNFLKSQEWANKHKWFIIGYMEPDEVKEIERLMEVDPVHSRLDYKEELSKILGFSEWE